MTFAHGRQARGIRRLMAVAVACVAAGCATAPKTPPRAAVVPFEQKMAWILRLEDQRVLRDPSPPPVVASPTPQGRGRASSPPPAPPQPDLIRLLDDEEARVRRRAALAIGRVGLAEGVEPLGKLLAGDPEPEVRQMAAFALGLIGDRAATPALTTALGDPSPLVQGRAAEALGLIGDASAAAAIGTMLAAHVGAAAPLEPDDLTYPASPPIEAFRLGAYALARLRAYEPLAAAVLDARGQPVVRWWPAAYALQRIEDRRTLPALVAFTRGPGNYGAAFAARGLGALKDPSAVDALLPLLDASRHGPQVVISAIRALGQIGDARVGPPLLRLGLARDLDPTLRLEVVGALGALGVSGSVDLLLDVLADPWPAMRAAALRALARVDPDTFVLVLATRDPDEHWSVRAALAEALGLMKPEVAVPRLTVMLKDADQRVIPAALMSLVRLRAPNAAAAALDRLKAPDVVIRATAARLLGELKPDGGVPALVAAYEFGAGDNTYLARAAALDGLASYGSPAAIEALKAALADKEWAVRVRAASRLAELDPSGDYTAAIRPVPTRLPVGAYEAPTLVQPTVSPHVYLETDKGTIQIELNVLDAPLTAESFATLARTGFFNGLPLHRVVANFVAQGGDPRGDGEGGPGYTVRDELNQAPYLRGTVGMALDWEDTGGSQFFITHSPQPHLDARYTVFGKVIGGMEVVDRLQQWDVIRRTRVWDGISMIGR